VTLLRVRDLSVFYGNFQALFGVSLDVGEGEAVAVIGANGAGKTTLLRALAGALPVARDAVEFDGRAVGGRPAHALVDLGIVLVPEGRKIFPSLSVEENLLLGR
jgi:branched-chain amino acid transport system ATP-binding protein